MFTHLLRILFTGCLCALATTARSQSAADANLRADLEKVYHTWRGAMLNRDVRAWQLSTSRYRQVHSHNMIVSQRQRYPDAVFAVPLRPPEITTLKLLEAQAVGETAHLVYFGRVDLGIEADFVPDNLLVLRFIRESDGWKFDTSRLVNLENAPEIRNALKEGGKPDFLDTPEFTPPGVAPPVPPVCKPPEYMAAFHINVIGYEAGVKINGFEYPPISDNATNQLIMGGLNRERNDLELTLRATEVPEGEERVLELNVMVIQGDPSARPITVYRYRTTEPNPQLFKKDFIWVNNSTLKR